ncbi:MAG: Omp28-related outer membrane protein [Flavobacteriia bacterium]|nr:Omp28-related outer membrane protein [Flavobacteriia bacterium]
MKKIILLGSVFASFLSYSQTFNDNFDSYTAGQNLGPQSSGAWTTWSNAPGGTEDVLVSNADAASAPNSLHFASTSQTGGPTDLMRHFGVLNTGQFSMEFNIKVGTGKAGYFNLQKTATPGTAYALDAFFRDNGTLVFNQQPNFSANYPVNTWFNFRLDINFNINKWEVFIDNVSVGYFSNEINQVEGIDIFPVDNDTPYDADYYIDDFSTTITPYTLTTLNAGVTYTSYSGGTVAGNSVPPIFKIRNLGTSAITSFDIVANYNGTNANQSFTGLNMASLAEQSFTLNSNITLIAGANPLTITVSNVNGAGPDGDANDNVGTAIIDPIVPAAGKMVITEEATGTWCGWCVRGAVYMGWMKYKYNNYWTGIAVHNGDPMVVTDYDAAMGALISGFPTALVDRGAGLDPSEMEGEILTRLQVVPKAVLTNGATWDAVSRTLNVSVSANFSANATNSYKIACALSEDSVTGTSSGYDQHNYYSSQSQNLDLIDVNGVNYKNLPSTIPAAQMVFDHVARAIAPSFNGTNLCLPATINSGETHIINFSFTLPSTWDENKIDVVSMLIDPQGKIDNGGRATIAEAIANGYVAGCNAGIQGITLEQVDDVFQIAPNPATTSTTITIQLTDESNVMLKVLDMSGKEVASRNYGVINGASTVDINTSIFQAGIYIVELTVNDQKLTKRLIIK